MSCCAFGPVNLIFALLPVFMLGSIIGGYIATCRKQSRGFRKLAGMFNGQAQWFWVYPAFSGSFRGVRFWLVYIPPAKNTPAKFRVFLEKRSSFRLSIYRENVLTLFGQKIGLVREVKVDDSAFDRSFLIFSNQPQRARQLLSSADAKTAVGELFKYHQGERFVIDGKRISFEKRYASDDLEPEAVKGFLQNLFVIGGGSSEI